ncbi:MAG: P-loop NTPase fold protein [Ignavibacteriaceae bacterium]|jgi:hypothetical protein
MKRNFIVDEEINLNENDLLNTKKYATTLRKIVLNSPLNNVFTIGLFGGWGSGKSSITKTVQTELEQHDKLKIKFIKYDAWKYANDSFRRMLLLQIQENLKFTQTGLMQKFYANESMETKLKTKFNVTNFIISCCLLIIGYLIVLSNNYETKISITVALVIPFLTLLSNILFKVFDQMKISIQQLHYFAPEQFEDCFKQMVSKSLKHYNWIQKTGLYISGEHFIKDIDKLVIVIDNIDRCHKELAYSLLTDIKTFLGDEKYNIVFIIPVDDEALKKHIINTSRLTDQSDGNIEAEEFLRKFFNITLRLKKLHAREIFDFTESLNKKYELNFNPTTIGLISKEYANNPRRIIQFFNNLSSELNNYDEEFVKQNEALICKFQVLKEEFPDYYKLISANPHLLNAPDPKVNDLINKIETLKIFLEKTRILTSDTPFTILETILTNSKGISKLPQEVYSLIDNFQFKELNDYIATHAEQYHDILKEITNNLVTAYKRQLFNTDFLTTFELLTSINSECEIGYPDNVLINENIQNYYEIIIDKCPNIHNLILYSISLKKQNISELKNAIIELVSNNVVKETKVFKRYKDILGIILSSYTDERSLIKLQKPFLETVKLESDFLNISSFSDLQIKNLISDEFVEYFINKIENVNGDDFYYTTLKKLLPRKELSNQTINFLIAKIDTKLPDFRGVGKDDIIMNLKEINELLTLTKNNLNSDTSQLQVLFDKFNSSWRIPNPNNPGNPKADIQKNLIIETLQNSNDIDTQMDFYSHIYRISLNNVSIIDPLMKILSDTKNRSIVNKYLVKLKKSLSLNPLFDIIVEDKTYSEESFILFEHVFTYKNNKTNYLLSEEKLKKKLSELLDYSLINDSKFYNFLERISDSDERIKNALISLISIKDKDSILKLTNKLQALAIDSIKDGEAIFSYEDNEGFLKVIASSGKPIHIKQLARVLVRMIQKEETLSSAISIIKELRNLSKKDSKNIRSLLESFSENEKYKTEIENAIEHIKTITEK